MGRPSTSLDHLHFSAPPGGVSVLKHCRPQDLLHSCYHPQWSSQYCLLWLMVSNEIESLEDISQLYPQPHCRGSMFPLALHKPSNWIHSVLTSPPSPFTTWKWTCLWSEWIASWTLLTQVPEMDSLSVILMCSMALAQSFTNNVYPAYHKRGHKGYSGILS